MIPQDYTVIDLEMTGLHPKNDAILEVGAAKIRNGEVTDTMDIFVNPGRKITQEITELTGITDEMVKEGLSPAAAFHKTAEFIGDDILVGHNIIFDYSFLKQQAVNEKVPFEKKAVLLQVTAISAHRCRRSTTLGNQIAYVILKVKHPTPPQKSPSTSHHYPAGKKIEGLFNESARSGQLADNRCAANNAGLTKGHPRVRRPGKRRGGNANMFAVVRRPGTCARSVRQYKVMSRAAARSRAIAVFGLYRFGAIELHNRRGNFY